MLAVGTNDLYRSAGRVILVALCCRGEMPLIFKLKTYPLQVEENFNGIKLNRETSKHMKHMYKCLPEVGHLCIKDFLFLWAPGPKPAQNIT